MNFHNPYHFIPARKGGSIDKIERNDFISGRHTHCRHERYEENSYSGRIICRLENEDPMVIGDEQKKEKGSSTISPFEIDNRPAIPSSTLRGLISSLCEAASNSALRVLDDRPLSVRADMNTALHHIGMLVEEKGEMKIRPLAIPAFAKNNPFLGDLDKKIFPQSFLTKYAPLRVYVDGYTSQNRQVRLTSPSFLATKALKSHHYGNREYWYMKLNTSSVTSQGEIKCSRRTASQRPQWIIGQQGNGDPTPQNEYETESSAEQNLYTRGILRVLGIAGRETEIPTTKKHEIFIPYPDEIKDIPLIDATAALEQFHRLADERTEADEALPFELQGKDRETIRKGKKEYKGLRLKDGDLVFFRPKEGKDGEILVSELAVSSIWRQGKGTCHEFFADIDPELLPMNQARQTISLAEQLFGFVEKGTDKDMEENLLALQGRLLFSDAQPHGPAEYLPQVPLKILDSPKPPSPSFYFDQQTGTGGKAAFIPKKEFFRGNHIPKGRKTYLHPQSDPLGNPQSTPPWKTRQVVNLGDNDQRARQRLWVTPVKANTVFYFHIDFNNLSELEMGMLLYCLRPMESFRHRLGLGKPIGLGRVRIDPAALFLVDRKTRYSEDGLFGPRYHQKWTEKEDGWKTFTQYRLEKQAATNRAIKIINTLADLRSLAEKAMDKLCPAARKAIELLGDPASVNAPVHYPSSGTNLEDKLFEWFVKNRRQFLGSLEENIIPTLEP